MKRTWTIIGVRDVAHSFRRYQSLFGQPATQPGHDYWGQLVDADGTVLLCLHQWGAHEHPTLTSPDTATPGNGLLLFSAWMISRRRLKEAPLVDRLEEEPDVNPATGTKESALRDPDGYYVMISSLTWAMKKTTAQSGIPASTMIDERINGLGDWRGEMLGRLRALIRSADPDVVEEWKWAVPVWSHDGLIRTGETYKKAVKLTFAKGASGRILQLFNSSLEGNTRRAIDFHEGDKVDERRSRRSFAPWC
jgi:hypothetical protein